MSRVLTEAGHTHKYGSADREERGKGERFSEGSLPRREMRQLANLGEELAYGRSLRC